MRVNELKGKGVVISGFCFPPDVLKFESDFHIHTAISKQVCLKRQNKFITRNKSKYPNEYNELNTPTESMKMNKILYPAYLKYNKSMVINKYMNVNDLDQNQIYDSSFNYLIQEIEKFLYRKQSQSNKKPYKPKKKGQGEYDIVVKPMQLQTGESIYHPPAMMSVNTQKYGFD